MVGCCSDKVRNNRVLVASAKTNMSNFFYVSAILEQKLESVQVILLCGLNQEGCLAVVDF
jgi:hypothetical protein